MALNFTTNAEPVEIAPDVPFTLDDQELTARCPKKRMWSRLVGSLSTAATIADEQFAVGSFMDACFGDNDRIYLERRYRDPEDSLDDDTMVEIFEAVLEEWAPYMADEVDQVRDARAQAGASNRAQRRQVTSRKPARKRAAKTPAAGDE